LDDARRDDSQRRLGVWLIGAFGSLATTSIVGCLAVAKRFAPRIGLVGDDPRLAQLGLAPLEAIVFGGHDVRRSSILDEAVAISSENGSLRREWIDQLRTELTAVDRRVRTGVVGAGGGAIRALGAPAGDAEDVPARGCIRRLSEDLRAFRNSERLDGLVVVNLASTEPPPTTAESTESLDALESRLDRSTAAQVRAGTLYACAAADSGAAFVNFAASGSCLTPAVEAYAVRATVPVMGSDGKTGETLVKSALAPMFRARRLDVMSWVGFNILGNRDGLVLSDESNKRSKLGTKDGVLPAILGSGVRTRVGIEYVESLGDAKVAWDHIHFRGFLGHPMSMQFTWQGCDSILAAPLVLDLARFADVAMRRGECGPMLHLASFFKAPIHCDEHDLHRQYERLFDYARRTESKRS
jgi:myo-inositol-1-phosphate synthase